MCGGDANTEASSMTNSVRSKQTTIDVDREDVEALVPQTPVPNTDDSEALPSLTRTTVKLSRPLTRATVKPPGSYVRQWRCYLETIAAYSDNNVRVRSSSVVYYLHIRATNNRSPAGRLSWRLTIIRVDYFMAQPPTKACRLNK